jgi:6-pyruvoyltetrahydropterin/6-carboxytetrahydropterin synthase
MELAISHQLNLPYESPCNSCHGHNLIVTVWCVAQDTDLQNDMVLDFTVIKKRIHGYLDHQNLNKALSIRPTAENLASWIYKELGPYCKRVDVQESEGNVASYVPSNLAPEIIAAMR